MDGNTIFENPIEDSKLPVDEEKKMQVHTFTSPPSSFPVGKILKILIGLFIVLLIGFVILGFALPKVFNILEKEKITIIYWGVGKGKAVLDPIISDFESKYPEIKLDYVDQNTDQYSEKLETRINNGTGPDIFRFHNTWLPMLEDVLLPLPTSVISKEDFSKNYYPIIKTDVVRNGGIYGLPLEVDALSLYINSDIFNAAGIKAPTTWIEFQDYARSLTVKKSSNKIVTAGAAMGLTANINHAPDIVSMLMVQNGVDLKNISSNISVTGDALRFYTSFAVSPQNVWDETLDSSLRAFSLGSLAMYFGYSRDYSMIKSINPNLSFEIHPVPRLPGKNITVASYWVEGVSLKSKYQKEALLFIKYLTEKETMQKLFAEESKVYGVGKLYPRIDLAESLNDNLYIHPFVQGANDAVPSFFADETFDNGLNTEANKHLSDVVNSALKGNSSESTINNFASEVSKVLQKYQAL